MSEAYSNKDMFVILPAGSYYLGDPCYAIDDEIWCEYCDRMDDNSFLMMGERFICHSTAHGDGEYPSDIMEADHSFGVDSGLIGLTPVGITGKKCHAMKAMNGTLKLLNNPSGPLTFEFENRTGCFTIHGNDIGSIEIYTDMQPCSDCCRLGHLYREDRCSDCEEVYRERYESCPCCGDLMDNYEHEICESCYEAQSEEQ